MDDVAEQKKDDKELNGMDLLLDWLSPNREEAIELYLKLSRGLIYYFRRLFDDAETLAGMAIDRTMRNLANRKVNCDGKAQSYVYGVASRIKLEEIRKKREVQLNPETHELPSTDDGVSFEQRRIILSECLDELSPNNRRLLLEYIYVPKGMSAEKYRTDLAAKWEISIGNLRVRIWRITQTLQRCAEKRKDELE